MTDRRLYMLSSEELDKLPLDEIEDDLAYSVRDLADIQVQLGDRNRTGLDGKRMEEKEYWEWRSRAMKAMKSFQGRVIRMKRYVKSRRRGEYLQSAERMTRLDRNDLPAICGALLNVTRKMFAQFDPAEIDPSEYAIVNLASIVLQEKYGIHIAAITDPSIGQVQARQDEDAAREQSYQARRHGKKPGRAEDTLESGWLDGG